MAVQVEHASPSWKAAIKMELRRTLWSDAPTYSMKRCNADGILFDSQGGAGRLVGDPWHDRQFLALLDDHGAIVLALLRRLCRNQHDAEDAFQETAVRVWR